jgi:hypothetical protein
MRRLTGRHQEGEGLDGKSAESRAKIGASQGTVILMLHLFVPPTSFENFGEHPPDWTSLDQMFAGLMVAVSLAALALVLCRALAMLFVLPDGFGPPPSQHLMIFM